LPTDRLYFDQPFEAEFEARVTRVARHGDRPALILDRTLFHPTGGGQPHDTGRLDEATVVDVVEGDDGDILHVLESDPGFRPDQSVRGSIDADRRRDHLQQHSGQHLLSAAFLETVGAATVSFHLGRETCTIDLDLPPDRIGALGPTEKLANQVIAEDRPMTARVVDEEEARALPLRKELPVTGRVRVVGIEAFDLTPCGGTHAQRSGQIGMLALLGRERRRKGTRVEFVAGDRVLSLLHRLAEESESIGASLSAPRGERAATLEQILADRREEARHLRRLTERAADLEAASLAAAANEDRVVRRLLEDRSPDEVAALARSLAARNCTALLGWAAGPEGRVALAGPGEPDVGAALRAVAPRFSLRGGGSPTFAQGGGLQPDALEDLLAALEEEIR